MKPSRNDLVDVLAGAGALLLLAFLLIVCEIVLPTLSRQREEPEPGQNYVWGLLFFAGFIGIICLVIL